MFIFDLNAPWHWSVITLSVLLIAMWALAKLSWASTTNFIGRLYYLYHYWNNRSWVSLIKNGLALAINGFSIWIMLQAMLLMTGGYFFGLSPLEMAAKNIKLLALLGFLLLLGLRLNLKKKVA